MYAKLRQWLHLSPPPPAAGADPFPAKERKIFKYWDGWKWVHADPMVLYKRVMDVSPELRTAQAVSRSQSKDARKAHDEVIATVRGVFDLKAPDPLAVDQGGLTEAESVELMDTFLDYCHTVKKNSRTPPTASTPTESPAGSDGDSPTSNTSPSGSTASASSPAAPTPST